MPAACFAGLEVVARDLGRQVADLVVTHHHRDGGLVEPVVGLGPQRRREFRRQPLDPFGVGGTGGDGNVREGCHAMIIAYARGLGIGDRGLGFEGR